jgi:hypothetical protein
VSLSFLNHDAIYTTFFLSLYPLGASSDSTCIAQVPFLRMTLYTASYYLNLIFIKVHQYPAPVAIMIARLRLL